MKMEMKLKELLPSGNKTLDFKTFVKAFHPLGTTTEQLMIKWDTLKRNPNVETIEDFVHKVNQLATVLKKTEADKVSKIKIASQSKDIYMLIMTCTSVSDIVSVINQMQAMNWLPSPGPKHSTQYTRVKLLSFTCSWLLSAQVKLLGLKLINLKILQIGLKD